MSKLLTTVTALLAVTLGGCTTTTQWSAAQVLYCPPGYDLRSDYLCWPRQVVPPRPSFGQVATQRMQAPQDNSGHSWGHDLGAAGAGAATALAGTELVKRGASSGLGAAVGEETAIARAGATARTAAGAAEVGEALEAAEELTVIEEIFGWCLLL